MAHGYAHGPGGGREIGVLTGQPRPGPVVCSLVRLGARAGVCGPSLRRTKKGRGGFRLPGLLRLDGAPARSAPASHGWPGVPVSVAIVANVFHCGVEVAVADWRLAA